jgi:hypothetical protein
MYKIKQKLNEKQEEALFEDDVKRQRLAEEKMIRKND